MNIGQIDISFTVSYFSYNRHWKSNEILSTCSIKMKGYTKIKKNECNITLHNITLHYTT